MQYTLHVSDSVVPGILGRGGQVIKDIQEQSGASIKVSQKGDYVPGTSLRIITISGNQVHPTPVQAYFLPCPPCVRQVGRACFFTETLSTWSRRQRLSRTNSCPPKSLRNEEDRRRCKSVPVCPTLTLSRRASVSSAPRHPVIAAGGGGPQVQTVWERT